MHIIIKRGKKENEKVDFNHLTPGERDALKQHEITREKFDGMNKEQKVMWMKELQEDRYHKMRNYHKKDNSGLRDVLTKKGN